jgi:two-component system response regulator GlrR
VLVHGEAGTGKELIAEAIHDASERRHQPFIVIDCSALSHDLAESELFGHERGAFTGADVRRIGAFESAHGGTIFLDEIGELPLALQPLLLRVLENRTIRRVGSNEQRAVDVRVVAASHCDLRALVNDKRFRPAQPVPPALALHLAARHDGVAGTRRAGRSGVGCRPWR